MLNNRFSYSLVKEEFALTVVIRGAVNEECKFDELLNEIIAQGGDIVRVNFDLDAVTRLNSSGIRDWILFVERIQERYPIHFAIASEAFMDHGSIIYNMFGTNRTSIDRFRAPYTCPRCNRFISVIVRAIDVKKEGTEFVAPIVTCEKCNEPLEFDGISKEYFGFLNRIAAKG